MAIQQLKLNSFTVFFFVSLMTHMATLLYNLLCESGCLLSKL